jgi:hypothetical protein
MSNVGFSNIGDSNQPSPSIWGDCPNKLLEDRGMGFFKHVEFLAAPTGVLAAALDITMISFDGALKLSADTDTVLTMKAAEEGGYLDLETDGDDNDAAALIGQPLGTIKVNSGKKLWFEARLELGVVGDQGVFVGLVEEAGATLDVVADDAGADGVVTESLIGFVCDNGDTNAFDIIYRSAAAAVVSVLADCTNAEAIPLAERASVVADTEVKLGIRFDGRDKLTFYVNGYPVAHQHVDSTFDQTHAYVPIIGVKTGAAAARSIAVDWMRYGYQART